jgi:hypothetical protein
MSNKELKDLDLDLVAAGMDKISSLLDSGGSSGSNGSSRKPKRGRGRK